MFTEEYATAVADIADMVKELRTRIPELSMADAIAIAAAAQQTTVLADIAVTLGDIADALNDMRPPADPRTLNWCAGSNH